MIKKGADRKNERLFFYVCRKRSKWWWRSLKDKKSWCYLCVYVVDTHFTWRRWRVGIIIFKECKQPVATLFSDPNTPNRIKECPSLLFIYFFYFFFFFKEKTKWLSAGCNQKYAQPSFLSFILSLVWNNNNLPTFKN